MTLQFATFIGLSTVVGLCIGSFLNVVIHRLPRIMERGWRATMVDILRGFAADKDTGETERKAFESCMVALEAENARRFPGTYNLVLPNSSCPHCRHAIRPWENIPVISFLFLRGRCSACKAPISWRYPSIELLTGLLTAGAAWHFGPTPQLLGAAVLIWFLVGLSMIDIDTQLLPEEMTVPLLWLGLLYNLFAGHAAFATLPEAILGAVIGYMLLWTVYHVFKLITNKEGMGIGDFKLLAALGAWLGWIHLPVIILAASLSGLLVAVPMMLASRLGWGQHIPFGPYLAMGGLVALFWGKSLLLLLLTLGM